MAIRLKSPAWPGVRITTLGSSLSHMMAQRRSVDGCKPVNDGGRCTRISASTRWLQLADVFLCCSQHVDTSLGFIVEYSCSLGVGCSGGSSCL